MYTTNNIAVTPRGGCFAIYVSAGVEDGYRVCVCLYARSKHKYVIIICRSNGFTSRLCLKLRQGVAAKISFSIQHYVHLRRICMRVSHIVYRFLVSLRTYYMLVLTPQAHVYP